LVHLTFVLRPLTEVLFWLLFFLFKSARFRKQHKL